MMTNQLKWPSLYHMTNRNEAGPHFRFKFEFSLISNAHRGEAKGIQEIYLF